MDQNSLISPYNNIDHVTVSKLRLCYSRHIETMLQAPLSDHSTLATLTPCYSRHTETMLQSPQ